MPSNLRVFTTASSALRNTVGLSLAAKPDVTNTATIKSDMLARTPNSRLFVALEKLRDKLGQGRDGVLRDRLTVPISPQPEPTDSVLFEDPAAPAKKYYLPRYRLRERGGRYEIGVSPAPDGTWRLSLGLERFPAPELTTTVQGAEELPHELTLLFRYRTGPTHAIEKTVELSERMPDAKGLAVSVGLTLTERDSLLAALQTAEAEPKLVVRRTISVAVGTATWDKSPLPPKSPRGSGQLEPKGAELRDALRTREPSQPIRMRLSVEPRKTLSPVRRPEVAPDLRPTVEFAEIARGERLPQGQRVIRYKVVQRTLDDAADPEPFVLDPRLHPYFYDGAALGGHTSESDYRRIVLAHPRGETNARFHAYLQDQSEPWIFYYLPDRFKLSRRDTAPYLPQMVVRMEAPDGDPTRACVTVDYFVAPWIDLERIDAALIALEREIPATSRQAKPELRPLQSRATLKLYVPAPNAGGSTMVEQKDVAIDLANGFVHSLTLPLEDFREMYGAAYGRSAGSLFSGQVSVETDRSVVDQIPVEIRFADTEGPVITFVEQAVESDGRTSIRMQNDIESPVRVTSLSASIRRENQVTPAIIEGLTLDPLLELPPGQALTFSLRPTNALTGNGEWRAAFDISGVAVLPDPERIFPLISDESVPAHYEREIEVMTLPELLGDVSDPSSILMIGVEFKGGGRLKLTRDQSAATAKVHLPLVDLLLGRDTQGKYAFRQQIIRRNGTQALDPEWREMDVGILVLPIA